MGMTSKEEASVLKSLAPFIQRTARKYFPREIEDAEQEGNIAAIRAMRSWRAESGAKLSTHCMRNIWWALHSLAQKDRRRWQVEAVATGCVLPDHEDGTSDLRNTGLDPQDPTAINAERALIILEVFNALSPEQQTAIEQRSNEVMRGQPTLHYQHARIVAAELMR
jgi:DNA-directed RNA polymerase specialized sigma24 family protein